MGIRVLFLYPNTYGMNMLPPAIALFSALLKVILFTLIFNTEKRKIYFQRLSGLINSILGKKSWYRPKILIN